MPSTPSLEHLTRVQEPRRLAGGADAGGRAGEDHVAGQKREHGRELGDQAGHAEDEIGGAGVLHRLAVDRAAEGEVLRVLHLVEGDEPRSHRPVATSGLAERELRAGGELQRSVADVLAHREAGDVRPGVLLVDPIGVVPMTATSLTSQSTAPPTISTSSNCPDSDAGNFVNVAGTLGTAIPDSSAWLR